MTIASHVHLLIRNDNSTAAPLVLLHGSGGCEKDLTAFAADLGSGSSILAIRGAVSWERGFAYFRRFEDRSIDEKNLAENAVILASFIDDASAAYVFAKAPVVIGFSNGAIMAAALLQMRPSLFSAAILLRPLSPFVDAIPSRVLSTSVLLIDGKLDRRRSLGDGLRLAQSLKNAGATVEHHALPVGHSLTTQDTQVVRDWLQRLV